MAAFHLTSGSNETNQASYNTDSISPGSNRLVLLFVYSELGAGTPVTPTASGNGLTWVEVNTEVVNTTAKMTLFRAMGASPSGGAITISFGAESQSRCLWQVTEFSEVVTTGSNGADAVVQVADNEATTGTSLTVTLSTFAKSDNATYGAIFKAGVETIDAGSGFTELNEETANGVLGTQTQWKSSADTSVDWSWATTATRVGAMAVEINTIPSTIGGYIHISN